MHISSRLPDSLPVPTGQRLGEDRGRRVLFWSQDLGTPTTLGQEEDRHGLDPKSMAWPWQQRCRIKASTGAGGWEGEVAQRPMPKGSAFSPALLHLMEALCAEGYLLPTQWPLTVSSNALRLTGLGEGCKGVSVPELWDLGLS